MQPMPISAKAVAFLFHALKPAVAATKRMMRPPSFAITVATRFLIKPLFERQ